MGKNGFRSYEFESPYDHVTSAIKKFIENGCKGSESMVGPENFNFFEPPYSTPTRPRYILLASNVPPELALAASSGWYCRRTEIPV